MKKRLRFKKPFDGLGNALQLIPESYRVDNKSFEMTDGNESYDIRWEGSLTEGRAVVLKASDANMVNEDIQKMKHLMGYKSQDTLGTLKGTDRINENNDNSFRAMLDKTRSLMTESVEAVEEAEEVTETENIDGQTAPKGDWDDAKGPKGDNHADHIMEEDEVNESEDTVEETTDIDGQTAPVVTEEDEVNESEEVTEEMNIEEMKPIEIDEADDSTEEKCPQCGGKKPNGQVYCSRSCSEEAES